MRKQFLLYWLRETGCDAGIPVDADELDAPVRDRVMALVGANEVGIELHLPFLDRREWSRRGEILREVRLVREGDVIRALPKNCAAELRDRAANLLEFDPVWRTAPGEFDSNYFRTWQRVSLALQTALRQWIPEIYFRDVSRYEDRPNAYPLIVYEASRPCSGRPRTEFTYDLADEEALPCALKMIGRSTQEVLGRVERRVRESDRKELAHRYLPIWYQDVIHEVKRHPRPLIALLNQEAAIINAVIDLGSTRNMSVVKPFAKTICSALRRVHGDDMRELATRVLNEATGALSQSGDRAQAA